MSSHSPPETSISADAARIVAAIDGIGPGTDPFVAAVQATRMPMCITNPRLPDNPIVFANDSFCRLSGYDRSELLGRNCRFLQGPDTDRAAVARLRAAIAAGRSIEIDLRNYRKSGEAFWNRLQLAPVHDEAGALAYFFASQVDVTSERDRVVELETDNASLTVELAARLAALQASEERLRFATEAAAIGVWEIALPELELTASPTLNAVYGQPPGPTPDYAAIRALAHPDDAARVLATFNRAIAGEAPYHVIYRARHADGRYGWVEVRGQVMRGDGGMPERIVGVSQDVTARHEAEMRLEFERESLQLSTDAAEVGTWDLDLTTEVLTWPARTKAMFGISPDVPCSMADFYDGLHPDDRPATGAAFAAAIDPAIRATYDVEYRAIGKEDGVVRWVAARGKGLFDGDRCVRAIGTAIDITQRRRVAQREAFLLQLSDRLRELADPAAIITTALVALGREIGVNRVGYGQVQEDDATALVQTPFAAGVAPLEGVFRLGTFGAGTVERTRAGETVIVDDVAEASGVDRDGLIAIGTRALVVVPFIRAGRLRANLFVHRSDAGAWHAGDVALIEEVAARTWDAVERTRAEAESHASEARLRAVIDAAPVGLIFARAPDGEITGHNATVERLLRHPVLPSPDVAHYADYVAYHPDGRQVAGPEYPLARALAGEERPELETLYQRGDGTLAYVRFIAAPIRGPDRTITGAVVASLDVDRERRNELRQRLFLTLADRVRRLSDPRAIVQATVEVLGHHLGVSRVGFAEVDAAARTITFDTDYTDGVDRLSGTVPLDAFGRQNIAQLMAGETNVAADVTVDSRSRGVDLAAMQARAVVAVPLVRDGMLRAVLYVHHHMVREWRTDEVTLAEEVAARTWDALERARAEEAVRELNATLERRVEQRTAELFAAEEALRQAQKMEAVGQLTGGIAHDFNNMLAVVLGSLDLLGRRLEGGDARTRRYVDAAADGARRAATLTQRLLAFSRQQPLQPERLDANRLVAGMSDLLRGSLGSGIHLETVLAGGLWPVSADPNQLENIILNLAINARDAMGGEGKVTIETHNCHLDDRYAAAEIGVAAGQYVLIAVTDTGAGMPPDVVAKAFDPFFTTKGVGKGTGLGLSQVYGFVKQSGGHVKIYSEIGVGTTVKLYLPRLLGAAAAVPVGAVEPQAWGGAGELILVVEDEASVRVVTVESLRELGYRVIEADGAAAALQQIEAHADIALLLTDIVMPDVNGARLAEAARALRPGLKVLFTTGYTRNAVVHNGVVDPGVDLIGKPFTFEALAAKVRTILDAG